MEGQHDVFVPRNIKKSQSVNAGIENTADNYLCVWCDLSYLFNSTACYLVPRVGKVCTCNLVEQFKGYVLIVAVALCYLLPQVNKLIL